MTNTTIEKAAEAIVAMDRECMVKGEEVGGIPEILRRLPRLAYELNTDQLVLAFRRAAAMHFAEADALRREVASRQAAPSKN